MSADFPGSIEPTTISSFIAITALPVVESIAASRRILWSEPFF
jgi:hypothetical protein